MTKAKISTRRWWVKGKAMPIDPLAGHMSELEQYAALITLDTAADVFEASPRETFTRDDVIRTLRNLKGEFCDDQVVGAYELAISGVDIVLPLSEPS